MESEHSFYSFPASHLDNLSPRLAFVNQPVCLVIRLKALHAAHTLDEYGVPHNPQEGTPATADIMRGRDTGFLN